MVADGAPLSGPDAAASDSKGLLVANTMRDIFEDLAADEAADPREAAQRSMRPALRKRFYTEVSVAESGGGFAVLLDGKAIRTPARRPFEAPARALAEALAAEWSAQDETIDPARMPLTRLANTVIDGVVDAAKPVMEEITKYLGSDLLFYRAEGPQGLLDLQAERWDPVLDWARTHLGARFVLSQGVMFVDQPGEAVAAASAAIPDDPWLLGGLHLMTTGSGSALLALAMLHGRITPDEAWLAADLDEEWNARTWGEDSLVRERRELRRLDMQAAATMLRLARPQQ